MSPCGWVVASSPWRRGRHRPGGAQECTQIGKNGPSVPFRGICVHCCAVGLGCGWPWDHNSVHKWKDRASPHRIGAFVYTVGLLRCCGQMRGCNSVHRSPKTASRGRFGAFVYTVASREVPRGDAGGRNSVHRSPKMASRGRFGAFVYTIATRVAIRIATRSAPGGTSTSIVMACRRRLLAGPSRLVGKTGSERAAPPLGWHLRRGINPRKPPKSPISCSVLDGRMLLIGSPA